MLEQLSAGDRRKLIGILGRLGSDHAGERAAAGLLATRLLQSTGMSWSNLLSSTSALSPPPRRPDDELDWRKQLEACMQRPELLTAWERNFVASVRAWRGTPTIKQQATICRIAMELRRRRAP